MSTIPGQQLPDNSQSTSPLYQYAIPAAIFLFAALAISLYFRLRLSAINRRRRELQGDGDWTDQDITTFLVKINGPGAGPQPLLVDVHLSDEKSRSGDWDEIMPISLVALPPSQCSPAKTTADDVQSSTSDDHLSHTASRLRITVLVNMPEPQVPWDGPDDERPLPAVEIGITELDESDRRNR